MNFARTILLNICECSCEVVPDCIHLFFLSRFGTPVRSLFVLALSYCNIFSLYVNLSRIHLKSLAYRWCGRFFFFLESEQSVILTSKKKRNKNINAKTKLWIDHRIFVFLLLLFFEHYSILQSSIGCVCVCALCVRNALHHHNYLARKVYDPPPPPPQPQQQKQQHLLCRYVATSIGACTHLNFLTTYCIRHSATPPHIYNIMNYDDDFSNWKKLYCILCITIKINK